MKQSRAWSWSRDWAATRVDDCGNNPELIDRGFLVPSEQTKRPIRAMKVDREREYATHTVASLQLIAL